MGSLSWHANQIQSATELIVIVLKHFDKKLKNEKADKLLMAAGLAFSDQYLFEKFDMWFKERDDEVFIFHIDRYFDKINQKKRGKIFFNKDKKESHDLKQTIRNDVQAKQKKIFGQRVTELALTKGFLTNDSLGFFLNVSGEQARKFKSGENKPQLLTLKKIADKFEVSVNFLVGLD